MSDDIGKMRIASKEQAEQWRNKPDLYTRMIAWLDAEEGRQLCLIGANPFAEGPNHKMLYSIDFALEPTTIYGPTREECFAEIERRTR